MTQKPWLYFGCNHGTGHYLYDTDMNYARDLILEKLSRFDGMLAPQPERVLYQASVTRLGGWGYLALSWWDRSGDRRPASNSIIFAPEPADSPEATLEQARRIFPTVFARQPTIVLYR